MHRRYQRYASEKKQLSSFTYPARLFWTFSSPKFAGLAGCHLAARQQIHKWGDIFKVDDTVLVDVGFGLKVIVHQQINERVHV